MIKRIVSLICIMLSSTLMVGCFNYKDINKAIFVTGVIIDVDDENHVVMYCEAFKGEASSDKGGNEKRLTFKGTGKTCLEATRDIALKSSFRLNYTQNKMVMFSQKAAEYGIDNFIDFFERDQELTIRPLISVYNGDCNTFIQTDLDEEKYIGEYVMKIIKNYGAASRAIQLTLNKYLNQRLVGDKTNIVPLVKLLVADGRKKVEIEGGAIIKEDKMIGTIKKEEGQGFNFLTDNVKSGSLEPENPDAENKYVTLEILNNKTKTDIQYDNGKIKLIKNIKVKTSLAEVQKKLTINENNLKRIQGSAEENIKKACDVIFEKYKDLGIDIFDIEEQLYRKYPKIKKEDVIQSTDLIVNADVEILTSGDTLDFID